MSYKIKHRDDKEYYRLTLSGEAETQEKLSQIGREIEQIIMNAKAKKVLMDITRLKGRFNLFAGLEHAKSTPEAMKQLKLATLDVPENKVANRDFELFATNHGFHFRFFTDKETAISWLKREL